MSTGKARMMSPMSSIESDLSDGDEEAQLDLTNTGFSALGSIVTRFSSKSLYIMIAGLLILAYLSTSSMSFSWRPQEPTLSRHTHARLQQPRYTQRQLQQQAGATDIAVHRAHPQPVGETLDERPPPATPSQTPASEVVTFSGDGAELPHIQNYVLPKAPFTGVFKSPSDKASVFVPPCPSLLSPPVEAELPPLYCPGQFLPLFDFNNMNVPTPLQMKWLAEDVNMPVEKVREELARDAAAHSPEGVAKVAKERASLSEFHTDIPSHPLRHAPPTLQSIVPHRRLFDFIIMNTELEWLDLRLQELWSAVDVFVVIESRETFSGKPKPLYYELHKERYKHYQSKILHIIIDVLDFQKDDPNAPAIRNAWDREHYQRQWPLDHKRLQETFGVRPGDLIMVSDIDEFPRTTVLHQLKQCGGWESMNGGKIALRADAHYYSWEFITHEVWTHPNLAVYDPNMVMDDTVMRWSSHADNAKPGTGPFVYHGSWVSVRQASRAHEARSVATLATVPVFAVAHFLVCVWTAIHPFSCCLSLPPRSALHVLLLGYATFREQTRVILTPGGQRRSRAERRTHTSAGVLG
jgi:hypothetical protein